jgi:hypothetical protein
MAELIRWIPEGAAIVADTLAAGPDAITIAAFQDATAAQISSDADVDRGTDTILGYDPGAYLYLGARSERNETTEVDKLYPQYNRAHALLVKPGETYQYATPEAVALHGKEFGDFWWYAANTFNWHDASLAAATGVAETTTLRQLDIQALEFAADDKAIFKDPGGHFLTSADTFLSIAQDALRYIDLNQHPQAARRMHYAAGQLLVATSAVLQLRLNMGLADVLPVNLHKIEQRIVKGNVFDANGGDTR